MSAMPLKTFLHAAVLTVLCIFWVSALAANDQESGVSKGEVTSSLPDVALEEPAPYISRAPNEGTYTILVMGDSLGVGLWQGLYQNFKDDAPPVAEIVQKAKVNTGIVRSDRLDWPKTIKQLARSEDFQVAVFLFGGNDMQSIRLKGKRHHYQTDGWVEHYNKRLDAMITALKDEGIALYWVGLPIVGRERLAADYQYLNDIFRKKAEEHGIRFVDTWGVTVDADGAYSQYGETIAGDRAKLRARDGVHFTPSGYRKLARFAEEIIRQDLATASRKTGG